MKNKFLYTLSITLISFLFSELLMAQMPIPAAPTGSARSYILVDFESGKIIAEKNAHEPMEPASITKLMTSYVVFKELKAGNISLNDQVTISEKAWRMGGSRMFVKVGTQVSVEELLKGMIIQSGNDASVALAEYVAGSEEAFANWMNHQAQQLGLQNTHFVNSTGWPAPDHFTTASDLAKLARALIKEFPEYYKWYKIRQYTYNDIKQDNRNPLLTKDPSADGIKTGHTESAGYCLVGSAKRDDMRLISIVLGTNSENARARESLALLNYGFRFFETHTLYQAGTERASATVWKGAADQFSLGLNKDLVITIPRGRYDDLQANAQIPSDLEAPINKGQAYGKLVVTLDGEVVAQEPLVALNEVPEGSLWEQISDEVQLYIESLF